MLFFTTLAVCELPALLILYSANLDKPVYLGSLRSYIPQEYKWTRHLVFLIFLGTEAVETAAIVFNALLYGMVFIVVLQSAQFWVEEMK